MQASTLGPGRCRFDAASAITVRWAPSQVHMVLSYRKAGLLVKHRAWQPLKSGRSV